MDAGVQEKLDEFIRRKGLRRTGQRNIIIKTVFSNEEHFTADELFERVRQTAPTSRRQRFTGHSA